MSEKKKNKRERERGRAERGLASSVGHFFSPFYFILMYAEERRRVVGIRSFSLI